jgi:hypothetical protein
VASIYQARNERNRHVEENKVTAAQAAVLSFLQSIRTFIMLGRLVHVDELSDAQDNTLDNTEHILESLETEIEDETGTKCDPDADTTDREAHG